MVFEVVATKTDDVNKNRRNVGSGNNIPQAEGGLQLSRIVYPPGHTKTETSESRDSGEASPRASSEVRNSKPVHRILLSPPNRVDVEHRLAGFIAFTRPHPSFVRLSIFGKQDRTSGLVIMAREDLVSSAVRLQMCYPY